MEHVPPDKALYAAVELLGLHHYDVSRDQSIGENDLNLETAAIV